MRKVLLLILIAAICHSSTAEAQQTPQMGFFIDEAHSEHCVYGSNYHAVDVYAFGRPGENGMKTMIFRVSFPDNVLQAYITYNDNRVLIVGTPVGGMYFQFEDCQDDWAWAFRQTVLIISEEPGLIQFLPTNVYTDYYLLGIQNCDIDNYYPVEVAERVSNVCINFCSEDAEPPQIEEVRILDKSTLEVDFNEELGAVSAEDPDNYNIFNRNTGSDSVTVASATLLGGGTTVLLDLATPFTDNIPYLLEANGVADLTGNAGVSQWQFGNGPDLVILHVDYPDTISGCGDTLSGTCTVANIGEYPALNSNVNFYYKPTTESVSTDVRFLDAKNIEELAPGDSVTVSFNPGAWWLTQNYYLRPHGILEVTVDSGSQEARVDNNELIVPVVSLTPRLETLSLNEGIVSLEFHAALYDSPDFTCPVTSYDVIRRVGLLDTYETVASIPADGSAYYTIDFPGYPDMEYTWYILRVVRSVVGTEHYYDNCVRYLRTGLNVAPSQPTGFTARQVGDVIRLEWNPNPEPDISGYNVWWSETGEWEPVPDDPYEPCASMPLGYRLEYRHTSYDFNYSYWEMPPDVYFRIYAYDQACHVSEYAIIVPDQVVSTELQSFANQVREDAIEVSWSIATTLESPEFRVFRSEAESSRFIQLDRAVEQTGEANFRFVDTDALPGDKYIYRVEVIDEDGSRMLFETDPILMPALALTLHQNHPNPFNPSTTISFYLPGKCPVRLEIFDVSGRRMKCLADESMEKGAHKIEWNGNDRNGNTAASGVYFYRLTAGKETISKKMILLR